MAAEDNTQPRDIGPDNPDIKVANPGTSERITWWHARKLWKRYWIYELLSILVFALVWQVSHWAIGWPNPQALQLVAARISPLFYVVALIAVWWHPHAAFSLCILNRTTFSDAALPRVASASELMRICWRFVWRFVATQLVIRALLSILPGVSPITMILVALCSSILLSLPILKHTMTTPFKRFQVVAVPEQRQDTTFVSVAYGMATAKPAGILDALANHDRWLASRGETGERLVLDGAQLDDLSLVAARLDGAILRNCSLRRVNLSRASLVGAALDTSCLAETQLYGAVLRDCSLVGTDLKDVLGLQVMQLAGANTANAKLPDGLIFDGLKNVEEAAKNARNLSITLLLACAYSWVAIAATRDANLVTNSTGASLPVLAAQVPIVTFYFAGPLLIVALFVYFQLSLQKIWEMLAALPEVFPDGTELGAKVYPWSLLEIVNFSRRTRPQTHVAVAVMSHFASISYAWLLVPLTLILYWSRYLPNHDSAVTGIHLTLLAVAFAVSLTFYWLSQVTLRDSRGLPRESRRRVLSFAAVSLFAAIVVAICCFISVRTLSGVETIPDFGFADLNRQFLSVRPPNWTGSELGIVGGAALNGKDLRRARAAGVFLANGNLQCADLSTANFAEADLRSADLYRVTGRRTSFIGARLDGASVFRADLAGADFRSASMHKLEVVGQKEKQSIGDVASWLGRSLEEIDVKDGPPRERPSCDSPIPKFPPLGTKLAELDIGSPDSDSDTVIDGFRDQLDVTDYIVTVTVENRPYYSANFAEAKFANADLRIANMPGTNLSRADLSSTQLDLANFRGANLSDANLWGASMQDANLAGADLTRVKGVTVDQLITTASLYRAHIEESLRKQVEAKLPTLFSGDSRKLYVALRQVKDNPKDVNALNNAGYLLMGRPGRFREALAYLQDAYKIAPNDMHVLDSLGWAYALAGELNKSKPLLERAASSAQSDPVMLVHYGDVCWRMKQLRQARQAWTIALKGSSDAATTKGIEARLLNAERSVPALDGGAVVPR